MWQQNNPVLAEGCGNEQKKLLQSRILKATVPGVRLFASLAMRLILKLTPHPLV